MTWNKTKLPECSTKERRNSTLLCMGRLTVDLYGEQRNTSLKRTRSFRRYAGGSSGNLAIGAARLGVPVGLITTVGDDPMGDYLMNVLDREGVCDELVRKDRSDAPPSHFSACSTPRRSILTSIVKLRPMR